jgi:surface-adhesin protein E
MPFSIRPHRRFPVRCSSTDNSRLLLTLSMACIFAFGLLFTLLLLSREPAYAEWVAIGDNNGGMTIYVNPDTIHRKGDLVMIWFLNDFSTARAMDANRYLSNKTQAEFDCAKERFRLLAFSDFSGNMGHGEVVHSISGESKLGPVPQDSIAESLWKFACDKY